MLDSVTSGLVGVSSRDYSADVPRGRGDKMGTIFTMLAPKKIVTAKKSPKFFAIVDNFQLISGKDQQIKKSEKLFIIYKPSHVR